MGTVLGEHPRAFRKVFALAQEQLRRTFGMEMRQLPVREKLTLEEKRKGEIIMLGIKRQPTNIRAVLNSNTQTKAAETWILVSTLPKRYQNPAILAPSSAPTAEYEATYVGFYTMVIALIALSGGEITEPKLKRHFQRLNVDNKLGVERTDDVLLKMEKSGYVVRKVENISADHDKNVSWLVGPRGKEEIGPEGVAGVVREVFGGTTPELERKLAASLGITPEEPTGAQEDEENGEEPEDAPEPRRSRRAVRHRDSD